MENAIIVLSLAAVPKQCFDSNYYSKLQISTQPESNEAMKLSIAKQNLYQNSSRARIYRPQLRSSLTRKSSTNAAEEGSGTPKAAREKARKAAAGAYNRSNILEADEEFSQPDVELPAIKAQRAGFQDPWREGWRYGLYRVPPTFILKEVRT
ncbi:unnamed protein product [Phytophthora lilii]|uniref:Unnamed protein product n=1 Tax=Phytophthora lilii TaxID=2077276 RepID=A0A9W6X8J7_9STRA|nr:unnamed protein product [Phytophthora lilii]